VNLVVGHRLASSGRTHHRATTPLTWTTCLFLTGLTTEKKIWRKKDELKLACTELDCNDTCIGKTSKRCSKSDGCVKRRTIDCRKKCRKQRCDTRCKSEPNLGYVEKEQKMDACKDECHGNERCMNKCEKLMESCKVKCRDNLKRYTCKRPEGEVVSPSSTPGLRQNQPPADDADGGDFESSDSLSLEADVEGQGDEDADSLFDVI
jgi:hypothetical protein